MDSRVASWLNEFSPRYYRVKKLAKRIVLTALDKEIFMKKKHLRSLNSLEKWLVSQVGTTIELKSAFEKIRDAFKDVPENLQDEGEALPPPLEISEEPGSFALYSDGGCRGNPGPGAFAFVVQKHDGSVFIEGVEFESLTTNNKMELAGPLKGLRELREALPLKGHDPLLTKIKVMTDSKYVVEGMRSWVEGWKARGWKKADNKAPENMELWQALDEARKYFMEVEWVWVRGHAGHPQNEYCDKRANEVMDEISR